MMSGKERKSIQQRILPLKCVLGERSIVRPSAAVALAVVLSLLDSPKSPRQTDKLALSHKGRIRGMASQIKASHLRLVLGGEERDHEGYHVGVPSANQEGGSQEGVDRSACHPRQAVSSNGGGGRKAGMGGRRERESGSE